MRSPSLVSALHARARRTVPCSGRTVRRCDAEVRVMRGDGHALSRRVRGAVAVVSLALVAVACSSGGGGGASSTSSVASTTPTASSASTAPATTTSTSSPTSTTTDAAAKAEAGIRAAIGLAQQTFSACLVAMPTCDPSTLAVARAGDLLTQNTTRINEWNAAGYTVRDRDKFRFVIEKVSLLPDLQRATATVCIADGSRLVKPGAGPGGVDLIIDDTSGSGREAWEMRLDPDGKWRAYSAPAVGPTETSDVCPAG